MRGIAFQQFLILFWILVSVELISYFGFRMLIDQFSQKRKLVLSILYLSISVAVAGLLLYSFSDTEVLRSTKNYTFFYFVIFISVLNLVPKSVFAFTLLFSLLFRWLFGRRTQVIMVNGAFLLTIGIGLVIVHSTLFGRYIINIQRHELYFDNLPLQFDGLKIIQLSDIHLGSFGKNTRMMHKTLQLTESLHPDLLLFTGDIVNNFAEEIHGFEPFLKKLPAKYGKYAIQGNHDYGDYSTWPDNESKVLNLDQIHDGLRQAGFKLLLNQCDRLTINDTSIYVIGVENWGHKPFPQYARLDQAMADVPVNSFQILLSHDPAHWNAVVVPETDIPLTFSGHTHGGQFAVKIAGIEFSPIYWIQKNWGGLYEVENQKLYVNRGLGTIGFPGRIEMRPEITVLTLRRTKIH